MIVFKQKLLLDQIKGFPKRSLIAVKETALEREEEEKMDQKVKTAWPSALSVETERRGEDGKNRKVFRKQNIKKLPMY